MNSYERSIRPVKPRAIVPRQECIDIRLCFRQLFHALDYVIVEEMSVGFRGFDDTVKHRATSPPFAMLENSQDFPASDQQFNCELSAIIFVRQMSIVDIMRIGSSFALYLSVTFGISKLS
ncbi:hypothetical protein VCHA54P500_20185 [Vibrio chagasii]|nr:hypothetical protein VCHA34P117_20144 [Vibrio chagasii]CAH6935810.1 hypothetical protein VCHA30O60_40198 [Vibrio chagasii]CAH7051507.1 hypothetical protein VCHA34P131_80054 [Vibrio chagasii]CAH7132803.1 hypothetical protein VCHA48P439_20144 [Vibrio chagasii]CAH7146856.1 hypothetical protein VCHA40O236_20144 [Vibrio chagasii]